MANSQFAIAVHVMAMLANNCDERMKSNYLAKSVNTNAVVIRRLLCALHEAGLVVSQTGYSGGSCLSHQPDEIKLLDIYEAVSHSEVFALPSKEPDQKCEIGSNIGDVLGDLQKEVEDAVKSKFEEVTLQNVIDRIAKKSKQGVKI